MGKRAGMFFILYILSIHVENALMRNTDFRHTE